MTNDQDDHGAASAKTGAEDGGKAARDASTKAVLDNMARLRALRLAREAAQPQTAKTTKTATRTATGKRTKTGSSQKTKSAEDKRQALSDWLAEQQKGGFRT